MATQTDPPNPLDKYLAPGWREAVREAGEYWERTFRTITPRLRKSFELEAYRKWLGRGNAP